MAGFRRLSSAAERDSARRSVNVFGMRRTRFHTSLANQYCVRQSAALIVETYDVFASIVTFRSVLTSGFAKALVCRDAPIHDKLPLYNSFLNYYLSPEMNGLLWLKLFIQ
jgi:hypothetical protein